MEVGIGLLIGLLSLVGAFVLEGGHVGALAAPTSALIVFGGTAAAIIISFPTEDLKRFPGALKVAFSKQNNNIIDLIGYFKDLSFKSRKEGLLTIESQITSEPNLDPFIKKGLQMVVDGVEGQKIKDALELQMIVTSERHKGAIAMFEGAGGFSPTMGIIGTVMGLVHVLGGLNGNPNDLGPKIAVAFIATLYGVASANVLWLPIGAKLKAKNKREELQRELIIDAILSIQEGINPNTLAEKLKGFLDAKGLVAYEAIDKNIG